MSDRHTEPHIRHVEGEQDTGNHPLPGTPQSGGADRFGGTRVGAGTLEPTPTDPDVAGPDGTEDRDITREEERLEDGTEPGNRIV